MKLLTQIKNTLDQYGATVLSAVAAILLAASALLLSVMLAGKIATWLVVVLILAVAVKTRNVFASVSTVAGIAVLANFLLGFDFITFLVTAILYVLSYDLDVDLD